MHGPYGLARLGVERVKPILTRGVLVDVAGYEQVDTLPSGYEVTPADVRGALVRQRLTESDIKPGDALLFNFGWWRLWPDPVRVNAPAPGVGREVAAWIVSSTWSGCASRSSCPIGPTSSSSYSRRFG